MKAVSKTTKKFLLSVYSLGNLKWAFIHAEAHRQSAPSLSSAWQRVVLTNTDLLEVNSRCVSHILRICSSSEGQN